MTTKTCFPSQINPPYYAPLVEVIPSPWTDPDIVRRTRAILEEAGQVPVTVNKEPLGFVVNRIQHALTAECLKLVNVSTNSRILTNAPSLVMEK